MSLTYFPIHKMHKNSHNLSISGIHPLDSKSVIEEPESWKEYEETIANQPECVAIGPCGLDYQRDFSEPDVQKQIFERQLELAVKLNKPVLIHERSAQADVLDILTKYDKFNMISSIFNILIKISVHFSSSDFQIYHRLSFVASWGLLKRLYCIYLEAIIWVLRAIFAR